MKRTSVLLFHILLFFSLHSLKAQDYIPNRSKTGICYAGEKVNRVFIPPPKGFFERSAAKGGGNISVSFTGFPDNARAAVEYAVKILESILPSDATLTVKASWRKISSGGVLGNSTITGFAAGWSIDALKPEAYYPVTVAEKISGRNINEPNEADVELVLNSSAKWYLGTDGNTPATQYDLVTVVIHELCHGLGFFDSMDVMNTSGTYGLGSFPVIYDTFVENLLREKLTDTTLFQRDTEELYEELTGGQLYFNGPLTRNYLSAGRPRLYAPSEWDPGSSVSHLDELRTNQTDALMTPFLDLGEAIHDPGRLTASILGDLGWINTRMVHEAIKDTEEPVTGIGIGVEILSDSAYNTDMVGIVYSFDDFSTSDTIMMSPTGRKDSFFATVSVPSYDTELDYYFFVSDVFMRMFRLPSKASGSPFKVFIGTDIKLPIIEHTPPEYFFEKVDTIHLSAVVTDNLGIDSVYVEYRINDNPFMESGMRNDYADVYLASLEMETGLLKGGDFIEYRIVAVDRASSANIAVFPPAGYNRIAIEGLLPSLISYSTDFSDAGPAFFNNGFEITMPEGFSRFGLHSEHPYRSPEEDYKSLEFTSVLRHPVFFEPSGMIISFDEVVLVEPGEEGSVYGFSDFYDYVILEGSNDFGKTWFSLSDGYDSRHIPSWESAYNSVTDDEMNSTFIGTESMMIKHTIYPRLGSFVPDGDELLVRFRLFSDPYANGWGWAVSDLIITPLVDNVEEIPESDFVIYPNPGNGIINIRNFPSGEGRSAELSIYTLTGSMIYHNRITQQDLISADISGAPSGIYLIVISDGKVKRSYRYNLVR